METEQPSPSPAPHAHRERRRHGLIDCEPGSSRPGDPEPDRGKPGHEEPGPCAAGPARTPAPPSGPAPSEPAPPGQSALPGRGSPPGPPPPPGTATPASAGPRRRVELGFRYDLPDPPGAAAAAEIADHAVAVLAERGASTVIGIGYGPGRLVTPVADAFAAAVGRRHLQLRELLRVEGARYWSYVCTNTACCPAEGTAFDYRSHPAAAAMTVAGLAAYPDRDAVAATIAPPAGAAARAMDEAIERACA